MKMKEEIMKKFEKFVFLFEPEDSSCLNEKNCKPEDVIQPFNKQSPVSLKAIVWIALSIVAGMVLGQL